MKNVTTHGWAIIRLDMCTEMEFGNLALYNVYWDPDFIGFYWIYFISRNYIIRISKDKYTKD